jgi:hypothetical protein
LTNLQVIVASQCVSYKAESAIALASAAKSVTMATAKLLSATTMARYVTTNNTTNNKQQEEQQEQQQAAAPVI